MTLAVTIADLQRLAPRPTKAGARQQVWDWYAQGFADHSAALFAEYGIDMPAELHDFMAHVAHESGGLTIVQENMNYTAPRIKAVFGGDFYIDKLSGKRVWRWHHSARVTDAECADLAGHPEALAERVYGLGNPSKAAELGNDQPGDGFAYRGFGAMQITGKRDHLKYFGGRYDNASVIRAALMEYTVKNCAKYAMACDIERTTKLINGGLNGLAERKKLLAVAQKIWPNAPSTALAEATFDVPPLAMGLVDMQTPGQTPGQTKTILESNTVRGASVGGGLGIDVMFDKVNQGVAEAMTGGSWQWFPFLKATVMNYQFWFGIAATVGMLLVIRERYKKGDLAGWFKSPFGGS